MLQLSVPSLNEELELEVYDWDAITRDDFMGYGTIDLSDLKPEKPVHKKVTLVKVKR